MASIALAGRSWDVPSLPWRAVRAIQPALLAVWEASEIGGARGALRLSEADLDRLADCVWRATQHATSGEKLTKAEFDELPIAVADIVRAIPAVAAACGLKPTEGGEDPGKA